MNWLPTYPRRVPARRPAGFEPRAPRWSAAYAHPFAGIACDYIALQVGGSSDSSVDAFLSLVRDSTGSADPHSPDAFEILTTQNTARLSEVVFVGYWTDLNRHARWVIESDLAIWFTSLEADSIEFGAWREAIVVPLERIETVYSSPLKEFGFAACSGISLEATTTNGYFGAARDRMPLSAIDSLAPSGEYLRGQKPVGSKGRRLKAELGSNVCAIRSGQYWQDAVGEQLEDYENVLEKHLMTGMGYLADHAEETGTLALRVLRSRELGDPTPRRETSILGYFRSLEDLEVWAAGHPTHHAIHGHAIEKNREYGAARTVTTWHEVFVLQDDHHFEYVNCDPETGVLPFARRLWAIADE